MNQTKMASHQFTIPHDFIPKFVVSSSNNGTWTQVGVVVSVLPNKNGFFTDLTSNNGVVEISKFDGKSFIRACEETRKCYEVEKFLGVPIGGTYDYDKIVDVTGFIQ